MYEIGTCHICFKSGIPTQSDPIDGTSKCRECQGKPITWWRKETNDQKYYAPHKDA